MKKSLSVLLFSVILGWAGATVLEGGLTAVEKAVSAQADALKKAGVQ